MSFYWNSQNIINKWIFWGTCIHFLWKNIQNYFPRTFFLLHHLQEWIKIALVYCITKDLNEGLDKILIFTKITNLR